jgi:uncharacterized protein (DUF58 family)
MAAPIWAAGTWVSSLEVLSVVYVFFCLFLFAIDGYVSGNIIRFRLQRKVESKLSLGADNPVQLSLQNPTNRTVAFSLRDEPPDVFEIERLVLEGEVNSREKWQAVYHVHPLRRGDYSFGDIHFRWQGPLGLIIRQAKIEAREEVKVYPNLLNIRRYDLLLRRNRLKELGLRRSRLLGEGTEFERLREYLPDDEFRRIDWKATSKRNRPITIEYQTERSQQILAVVDVGRMMRSAVGRMAKLDFVINAVLLLAYVAVGKGDKTGLMTFADEVIQFLPPRGGRGQFYRMLESLYGVKAQPVEPDYESAFNYLAHKQRKRALVIIFTDLSGGISMQTLVKHAALLSKRSLTLVVTISDPDIHAAAQQIPQHSLEVYQRAAAIEMLDERKIVLESLTRRGVHTLDVPADRLSMDVINRYLELKGRLLL